MNLIVLCPGGAQGGHLLAVRSLESGNSATGKTAKDRELRSLGELSWHLAEVDAYTTWGIEPLSA